MNGEWKTAVLPQQTFKAQINEDVIPDANPFKTVLQSKNKYHEYDRPMMKMTQNQGASIAHSCAGDVFKRETLLPLLACAGCH